MEDKPTVLSPRHVKPAPFRRAFIKRFLYFGIPAGLLLLLAIYLIFKLGIPQQPTQRNETILLRQAAPPEPLTEPSLEDIPAGEMMESETIAPEATPPEPEPEAEPEPAAQVEEKTQPEARESAQVETAVDAPQPADRARLVRETSPQGAREEKMAAVKAAFLENLPAALDNGTWGRLKSLVSEFESELDNVVGDAQKVQTYKVWMAEWDNALNDSSKVEARLNEYASAIKTLCEGWKISPVLPPASSPSATREEAANTYCRILRAYQVYLVGVSKQWSTDACQAMVVLGSNAVFTFQQIGAFIRSPDQTGFDQFKICQEAQRDFQLWITSVEKQMPPAADLSAASLKLSQDLQAAHDAFWKAMFQVLYVIRVSIGDWESRVGASPLLNNIDSLQFTVDRNYRQNLQDFQSGAAKWPRPADLPGLKKLFEEIGRFVAGIQSQTPSS